MIIGLMGLKSNGTLVTPSGKNLFRLPIKYAAKIQGVQHKIAVWSWKRHGLWFN